MMLKIHRFRRLFPIFQVGVIMAFQFSDFALGEDVVLTSTYDLELGQSFIWKVPREDFEKMDRFKDTSDELPLSLKEALLIAEAAFKKKHPESKSKLSSATLQQPTRVESWIDVYFYSISFEVIGKNGRLGEYQVVVLPNGKVLNPEVKAIVNGDLE